MNYDTTARYLFLDPGETIGWATFNGDGRILEMGQFRHEPAVLNPTLDTLLNPGLLHVVCEDFVRYKHKQQRHGGRNYTSEVIGKVEMLCDLRGIPHSRQPASVYKVGAAWGGFEIPTNHSISHQWVAAAHGYYYLQQSGIRKPGAAIPKKDI